MISLGYKIRKNSRVLVNKNGSPDAKHWGIKKPSFSFVHTTDGHLNDFGRFIRTHGLFRCRQTGQCVVLSIKANR